mgnify:CR=1 FL=1
MKDQLSELTKQVDALHIVGDMIPSSWWRNIPKPNGKTNDDNAAKILSDLVYWYRSKPVYGDDGEEIGREDKYYGKYVQRSYADLSRKYRMSVQVAKASVANLERLGLVKRHFDRECRQSTGYTGAGTPMYIELLPEAIKAITTNEPDFEVYEGVRRSSRKVVKDNPHVEVNPLDEPSFSCAEGGYIYTPKGVNLNPHKGIKVNPITENTVTEITNKDIKPKEKKEEWKPAASLPEYGWYFNHGDSEGNGGYLPPSPSYQGDNRPSEDDRDIWHPTFVGKPSKETVQEEPLREEPCVPENPSVQEETCNQEQTQDHRSPEVEICANINSKKISKPQGKLAERRGTPCSA